jgi:type IX secretion system PorP/SprF family membrane protein
LYIIGGGVGLSVENETIGSRRHTAFSASYARQLQFGKDALLSIGASGGFVQGQLDGSKVRTPSTVIGDQGNVVSHGETLPLGTATGAAPTIHLGAFYQKGNMEVGISAINLLGNKLQFSDAGYQLERTYFLFMGYKLDLNNSVEVIPSILLKSDVQQTQIDFSLTTRVNENIFVGGSLRGYNKNSLDAVALTGGFKLSEKLLVGYAYDIGISGLSTVNSGSHELLLNYNLGTPIGKGRPPAVIYNPRSL